MAGDRGHRLAALAAGEGDGQHIIVDSGGPTASAALGQGGTQAVEVSAADQLAFHLRGHRGDHEQHLVGDGGASGRCSPAQMPVRMKQGGTAGVQLVLERSWARVLTRAQPIRTLMSNAAAILTTLSSLIPSRNLRSGTPLRDWFPGRAYPPGRGQTAAVPETTVLGTA